MAISTIDSTGLASAAVTQPKIASGVAGSGPVLCVQSTNQPSLSASTWVKIPFNSVVTDTASCWGSGTYNFTPNVAGYYLCTFNAMANTASGIMVIAVRKNDTDEWGTTGWVSASGTVNQTTSTIISCNGTTDYISAYVYCSANNSLTQYSWQNTMNISLIRSA